MDPTSFETHPDRYKHWRLSIDGEIATLVMSVDTELADAIQGIRFEHPEVMVVVITADLDRVFCSGANIYMLGLSSHSFKVNFCKFTNETRLYLEDASANSGLASLAACKGTTAGGGYELALACDETMLVEHGNSAGSFPETPLPPGVAGTAPTCSARPPKASRASARRTGASSIISSRARSGTKRSPSARRRSPRSN